MDNSNILESGILESYVLGQASPVERAQVEQLANTDPAVKAELASIEEALEKYASASAVQPPTWMKGRIEQMIAEESKYAQSKGDQAQQPSASKGVSISKPVLFLLGFLGVLTMVANWMHQAENKSLQSANQTLQTQVQACQTREAEHASLKTQVALLTDPATKNVKMGAAATDIDQASLATVFYNCDKKEVVLSVDNLAQLSADQDYQLWIITTDNPNPQPLNVFKNAAGELVTVLDPDKSCKAAAFAVSLEPKGGTPNGVPTKVLLLGKVG